MTKVSLTRKIIIAAAVVLLLQLAVGMPAFAAPATAPGAFYYTVQWGDSLSSIAWQFGDNAWNLAARNGIGNPNYVRAGQVLYVVGGGGSGGGPGGGPGGGGPHGGGWGNGNVHVVRWGESLWSIACAYGTTPWAIASANGIYNINCIRAGQVLRIPR